MVKIFSKISWTPAEVCPIAVDYYPFPSVDTPFAACSSHSHRPYPGFAVLVLQRNVVVRYTLFLPSRPTSIIAIRAFWIIAWLKWVFLNSQNALLRWKLSSNKSNLSNHAAFNIWHLFVLSEWLTLNNCSSQLADMVLIFILKLFCVFLFHLVCFILISSNSLCELGWYSDGRFIFGHSQFLFSGLLLVSEAVDALGACGCRGSYSCDCRAALQNLRADLLKQAHTEVYPWFVQNQPPIHICYSNQMGSYLFIS